jgi:hypothetical protein
MGHSDFLETFPDVSEQIRAEYGPLRRFLMLHPYLAVLLAMLVGFFLGRR